AETIPICVRSSRTSQRARPNNRTGGAPSPSGTGYTCRLSNFNSVDLPAPFGPRIAACSPSESVSVNRSRTRVVPYCTVASRSSTIRSGMFEQRFALLVEQHPQRVQAERGAEGEQEEVDRPEHQRHEARRLLPTAQWNADDDVRDAPEDGDDGERG